MPVTDAWFGAAIRDAVALRRDVLGLDRNTNAYRVVNSEADRLPGLIVDRYADVLSCRVSSLGAYRVFPVIRDALKEALQPRVVHVAADPRVAKREGFPIPDGAGDAARATITEGGLSFHVDCARGHKTGFFLDQREARRRVRALASGRRVLDLFCYTGAFALNAARGGARDVLAIDLDEKAVAAARENAARNGLSDAVSIKHEDAFDILRSLRRGRFDLMVLDPAKQGRGRSEVERSLRYYFDLNRLAIGAAPSGGLIVTCSCTGAVREAEFLGMLADAAATAGRAASFLEIAGAPADHPVATDHPEGRYLKRVLMRVS